MYKGGAKVNLDGLPSTIRTCDLRLRRAVLYPAELWAVFEIISEIIAELLFLLKIRETRQNHLAYQNNSLIFSVAQSRNSAFSLLSS